MTAVQLRNVSVGVGAALLLTFLFVQQRPVNPREHDRFVSDLRLMKQLDAEINGDLIDSRYELLRSYDPFVHTLEEMQKTAAGLRVEESVPRLRSLLEALGDNPPDPIDARVRTVLVDALNQIDGAISGT